MLVEAGGVVPIRQIAEGVGWSHKHLIAKFTEQIGLPPKIAARIIRFDRARRQLCEQPRSILRRVAADCGYSDQSHFNRDFRTFSGLTPSEYQARLRYHLSNPYPADKNNFQHFHSTGLRLYADRG
ncbi:helix-turn-helix domain-containing protein [Nocardia sp. CY41]|uniref:helix-turn-helix domain-containing protein n=1 Tax=Nocardia sp. CY41 TaxID=2608686 RepID=UPI003FA5F062